MDSEHDSVVGVYSEAKSEYSRQLTLFIQPVLTKFFFGLLDLTKTEESDVKKHIWAFQNKLSQIPDWNQDKVIKETGKIQSDSGCDYLEELLAAVFIAHTKVLSSIRLNNRQKKLQISIPKVDHFLHRTLSECSRVLWSSAYLFNEQIGAVDKQKNMEKINNLICECIIQAVRSMLPVKNILREYLTEEPDTLKPEPAEAVEIAQPAEPVDAAKPLEPVMSEKPLQPVMSEKPVEPVMPVELVVATQPEKPAELEKPVEPVKPTEFIVADTEQSVHFAEYNTVFDGTGNTVEKMIEEDDGLLKFDENDTPAPLTDFEDLDNPDETIPIDFEEL